MGVGQGTRLLIVLLTKWPTHALLRATCTDACTRARKEAIRCGPFRSRDPSAASDVPLAAAFFFFGWSEVEPGVFT